MSDQHRETEQDLAQESAEESPQEIGQESGVEELRNSQPNATGPQGAAGTMGVSSERTGPAGPGQHGTDGMTNVRSTDRPVDGPPEQSPGGPEENPEGLAPKAGYPKIDPRSGE